MLKPYARTIDHALDKAETKEKLPVSGDAPGVRLMD